MSATIEPTLTWRVVTVSMTTLTNGRSVIR
jgi:hypothetical protein